MKFDFDIINLDCASCSVKIERAINGFAEVKFCNLDFIGKKLTVETTRDFTEEEIIKFLEKTIHIYEKDVTLQIAGNEKIIKTEKKMKKEHLNFIFLGLSLLLFIFLAIFKLNQYVELALYIVAYLIVAYEVILKTFHNIRHLDFFDENFLMTVASIGAFAIGQFSEAVMVMILYNIGESFQNFAVEKSKKDIKSLIELKSELATIILNGEEHTIKPEKLKIGDIIVIKPGEKVPVDSEIISGESKLDTSMLTGESELVALSIKDEVLSGYINNGEVFEMKVRHTFNDSTVSRILELVENATDKKADLETTVAKFSKVYTPTVLLLAILTTLILSLFTDIGFNESLYRGLTFLVISCPCAIAISVPLSYFTGIGVSSKHGIFMKGSDYLDNLSNIKKIIFDKTGTLTTGSFEVEKLEIVDKSYKKDELIELIRKGESLSNHPIAKSIMKLSKKKVDNHDVVDFKEITGKGIEYKINDQLIRVGNIKLCQGCQNEGDIHVNINGKHIASIMISDGIKKEVKETISLLEKNNIDTYMFTGDKKEVANEIGKRIGIKYIKSEMLPDEKYHTYEKVKDDNKIVAFVGDGINDAPVLKRADIGISMGAVGSFQAIESSDVVIMQDDLSKIVQGINISLYTKFIIKQNLCFAILVKVSILIFSVLGLASMWLAVFADTGVTVLTILNTIRIMKKKY